ncbi:MAG TPA: choice-of-anchor Q domain-containing protein [Solirubrobacteraceae bacterium]|jgi:hypothetical protein
MAATYTVGTTADSSTSCAPATGTCSLRQIIDFENGIATPNPVDTIVVPAGTYVVGSELSISQSMSIVGAGARVTHIQAHGGRVFDIGIPEGGGFIPNVAISRLQISDGSVTFFAGQLPDTGFGGDVRNLATLTLDQDLITGGTATAGSGGGISNEGGTMTISNSLVSGNASVVASNSGGDSGGVQNFGPNPITGTPGHLSIVNSTIAGNTSALGGGVFSWCGGGGGPCSQSGAANTTSVVNSTIAHNDGGTRGTSGGGLLVSQGSLSVQNSIVALNTVDSPTAGHPSNCGGTAGGIVSAGHNLDSGTDCGFHAAGDISGTDPGFTSSAAQNNGGDTDTLGLSATSPAVDALPLGASGCGGSDQRGTSRPQGNACDLGSYELFEPQEGTAFSAQVALATVNVTGPITIGWGDGTSSAGALASGSVGPILGAHTYAEAGTYSGTVTWRDAKGNKSATFSMKVTDAPLSAAGFAIAARVGTPFSGQIGSFTDPNRLATPADFSVTVNWGDGTTSPGAVSSAVGSFVVSATHTYASPAGYTTTITIHDVGGASTLAHGVANVITVHGTSTLVGCSPTAVTPGRATTCTATVSDDGPGTATTPTGTVGFSSGGAAKLSGGGQCNLNGIRGSATCAVSFTPGRTQSDTPTLTVRYGGDLGHTGSSASTTVAPVAGMTANVAVVHGTVLISLPSHRPRAAGDQGPSSASYVPLKGAGTIPVGATVDATNGTVMLATAADYHGALDRRHRIQSGIFSAAIFTIEQLTAQQQQKHSHRKATGMPPTNLRLLTPFATTASIRCHAKGPPGRSIVRELSARAKGFFRVIAAASVTIVRNAQWTVEDRCDGTLTGVGRGKATVTYFLHHRPVTKVVKPGGGLLVRQRFPVPPPATVVKGIPLPAGT